MKVVLTITVAVLCLFAAHANTPCSSLCSANARSCQTAAEAANCKDGYGLSSENKCVKCGKTPTKGTGNTGSAAGGGKWWEPWNSGTCTTCVTNCETCATKTTCKTCAKGYRLNGNACEACTVTNCDDCTTSKDTCDACNAKFPNIKTDKKECLPKCAANQFGDLTAGTCTTCDANAASCDSKTAAKTCKAGYRLTGANPNKCEACSVANCAKCDTSKDLCDTCLNKYAPAADKKSCANVCDVHCTSCTDSNTCGACDKAKQYYLTDSGRCKYCAVPLKADKSGPDNEKTGNKYFFDKTNGGCGICDANADGCTSLSEAKNCKTGYVKSGKICTQKCPDGATKSYGGKGKCYTCGAQVVKGYCADYAKGLRCNAGYHIQGSGVGACCSDNSDGSVHGLSALVAGVAAIFAVMH